MTIPLLSPTLLASEQGIAVQLSQSSLKPWCIDFNRGALRYRQKHLQKQKDLLAKAIGWKGLPFLVWDLTAGFAQEAFLVASLGCTVTLFERHPVIATLLQDGLDRAQKNPALLPIIRKMTLRPQCAIGYLQTLSEPVADVLYCDPMFEKDLNRQLSKKPMQYLQSLVKEDKDAELLVHLALKCAKKRVVVKRSKQALPLAPGCHHSLVAKNHRFDVYFPRNS